MCVGNLCDSSFNKVLVSISSTYWTIMSPFTNKHFELLQDLQNHQLLPLEHAHQNLIICQLNGN